MCLAVFGGLCLPLAVQAQVKVDAKLPDYKAVGGVSGSLKSIGSDTMSNEMTYGRKGSRSSIQTFKGRSKARARARRRLPLIAGTANFGPMSRPMKGKEIDNFKKQFGYEPTALPSSIDMLAIYVHKDNPLKGLTLQQADAIFSRMRKGGFAKDIKTWGDLGLEGEWAAKPIALYGRNAASGTYGFFKERVLFDGDYKNEVKEQPGSSSVVQGVASDKYAIGYSGIGYKTADVRALPLAINAKSELVPPEANRAYKGEYPLARLLYVYVNYAPNSQLDPLRREFVRYIFSKEGQLDVVKAGYLPVGEALAVKGLKSVGLSR